MSDAGGELEGRGYARLWRDAIAEDGIRLPRGFSGRARLAVRSVAISGLSMVRPPRGGSFLRCLYCHYVFDDQRARFDRLLGLVQEMGSFVDTATCVSMVRGERPIDGRYFHLSFDDGFRNVLENAAPILSARGIPALMLVPSALIGTYWGPIEMLDWAGVRELRNAGFTIGSHARTHSRLAELSPRDLRAEVADSKEEIENRIGDSCKYFSWPFGGRGDLGDRARAYLVESGYEASFGAFRGSVRPGVTDPFCLPRHHVEPEWPASHVRFFAGGHWEES
jgi:peptidoglycan/xylan/chitin deacetylase (PgdA/CDA1 family)